MREIEYRGWDSHNKRWVYGLPIMDVEGHLRIQYDHMRYSIIVDPNSLGEHAGLKDENDKKIWMGDIFKDDRGVVRSVFRVPGGFAFEDNPAAFGYDHRSPLYPYSPLADLQSASWLSQCCEVIGNIHDNPELLKTE